jgi:hypothetical protein
VRRLCGVLFLLAGCDDTLFGPDAAGGDETTPSLDGYAGVQEMVDAHCLNCHGTTTNHLGQNLDLETDLHGATVGVAGAYGIVLVVPNAPEESLLYMKITNTQPATGAGIAMPPGDTLGTGTTQVVADWILAGAPAQ